MSCFASCKKVAQRALLMVGVGLAVAGAKPVEAPANAASASLDSALRVQIEAHRLRGRPGLAADVPPPEAPMVVLGRELFFSKALSGDGKVSCASCHHPLLAGGDALSLPVGVDAAAPDVLGPARRYDAHAGATVDPHAAAGPNVPRNSPTIINSSLYRKTIFFDGRVQKRGPIGIRSPESVRDRGRDMLAVQARLPVVAEDEMRGYRWLRFEPPDAVREQLVDRLRKDWQAAFARAFGDAEVGPASVTFERMELALSDYQSSFVLTDNPWFRYIEGDVTALTPAAKRGALLFYRAEQAGGLGCAACHQGDFFTDEKFHVLAMPQIGRGIKRAAPGFGNATVRDGTDLGRWESTRRKSDRYAFRTPSLLNIAETGPYGHAGTYASLDAVIRHHLDPVGAIAGFDFALQHLAQFRGRPDLYPRAAANTAAALEVWKTQGRPARSATDAQIADLVAFLDALTDDCIGSQKCMSRWMPDPSVPSPDGARAEFVDASGRSLRDIQLQ
ncbi:MAG: cytochrome c peroxidase [Pseudomonadota bacterium]